MKLKVFKESTHFSSNLYTEVFWGREGVSSSVSNAIMSHFCNGLKLEDITGLKSIILKVGPGLDPQESGGGGDEI